LGKVNERTGIDGKTYAIGFEFRLPSAWNKRFLYQANGGSDGSVEPAIGGSNGTGGSSALSRGFAVISTDAGHNGADPENQSYGFNQGVAFGLDPQARLDYGYTSTGTMAPIAKDIIKYYYGRKPRYSYMAGCSNGGRHGMVAASRYPGYFDGILTGAPGFNLPKTALQHAWDVQSFEMVNGDMRSAFSSDDLQAVADAVLDACDDLDGIADGMVYDIAGCQDVFDLSTAELTTDQQTALAQSMGGPVNAKGEQLYSDWPYDPGMATNNWSFWKLNSGMAFWDNYPLIVTMGGGSLSYVFTTPPTEIAGDVSSILAFLEDFDFDTDAPKIYTTTDTFTESALSFMRPTDADDPTLDRFRKRGGKLLIYHGQSDGAFSVNDTINWYEKLMANTEDDAGDFARLFVIPGMGHCSGGCATDQFDALGALMNWVEKGEAPDQLFAWVDQNNAELPSEWSTTRTRPLCVWPKIAVYVGGDIESADSYECQSSLE
jgi:feruloyl esterase